MSLNLKTKAAKIRLRKGFSLTEFAVVLGIMGIVLGALWGVVGIVRENIRRSEMASQVVLIVSNVRDFYMAKARVEDESGNTDYLEVTDYLLRHNVIPPDTIRDRSATTLVSDTPWGPIAASGDGLPNGGFLVGNGGGVLADYPTRNFNIRIMGLGRSTCIALAAALTGSNRSEGLVTLRFNIADIVNQFPVSPEIASQYCVEPSLTQNMLSLEYDLRKTND